MDWEPSGGFDSEAEDGELPDSPKSDRSPEPIQKFNYTDDKPDNFSMFDDDTDPKNEKAIRFGIGGFKNEDTLVKELELLYNSLSIKSDEDFRHAIFDTIHMYGTENLTTNDIFEYFVMHKPTFLEWIDDYSCDVVWKDNISAAKAMVYYSKPINDPRIDTDDQINELDLQWNEAIDISTIPIKIPPGKWRAGNPHPKSKFLFLRFGNKSDKKLSEEEKLKVYSKKFEKNAQNFEFGGKVSQTLKSKIKNMEALPLKEKIKNPWGDLSKSWGINDSQEVFIGTEKVAPLQDDIIRPVGKRSVKDRIGFSTGAHQDNLSEMPLREARGNNINARLGKRVNRQMSRVEESEEESSHSSDEEWKSKSKIPRMRMHADDEEAKASRFRIKAPSWGDDDEPIRVEVKNIPEPNKMKVRLGNQAHQDKHKSTSVHSRLGSRREFSDSNSDSSDSYEVEEPISKPKGVIPTIWSRLDAKKAKMDTDSDENSDSDHREDLRSTLASRKKHSDGAGQDLRKRISKKNVSQRSPLRIEIDNELCSDS